MQRVIYFLACVAVTLAQGPPLDTYDRIREALLGGSELQVNAFSDRCENSFDPGALLVSMPFRHWQIVANENGETIRADDFYVGTPPGNQEAIILRQLTILQDDTAVVVLSTSMNGSEPLEMNCELGQGAVAHRLLRGNDLEQIDEYQEVKSRLLFGDHVEAIGNLQLCDNAADVLPEGVTAAITGYQINRFEILNEATDDETLIITDTAVIPFGQADEGIAVEQLILRPDGSVNAIIAVLSTDDLSQVLSIDLTCQLGAAFEFTWHEREPAATYATYEEVRESTINGHDLEIVVFLENCETLEGTQEDWTGVLASARFDEFQLFPRGSFGSDREFISFTTYGIGVQGDLNVDVIRVYEDNSVTIEYFTVPAGSTGETNNHLLSCPLETAAVFHAVPRNREAITNYGNIAEGIIEDGRIYEIEINFGNCRSPGFPVNNVLGGIIWESYIDPLPQEGFYFGSLFRMIQTNVTGTPSPGWEASDVLILPDNSVEVTFRIFDFFTGANLFPDAPQEPFQCTLGDDFLDGVRLFRWP